MKFEVITGEDAEMARQAGAELEMWNADKKIWVQRLVGGNVQCDPERFYRLKPNPPKKRRVPLADLRVLAGAMLVCPETGHYEVIKWIKTEPPNLITESGTYGGWFLAERGFHYDRGAGPVPCWTEVEE